MKGNKRMNPNGCKHNDMPCEAKTFLSVKRDKDEGLKSLGIVLRITEAATKSESLQELWDAIVTVMLEETDFENASLLLYDSINDVLELKAALDISQLMGKDTQKYHDNLRFSPGDWITWQVYESYSPALLRTRTKIQFP